MLDSFKPGWDCHGLPIEQKVNAKVDRSDPLRVRKLAKEFALKAVHSQRETFKSWGIMADWNNPYLTMGRVQAQRLETSTHVHRSFRSLI